MQTSFELALARSIPLRGLTTKGKHKSVRPLEVRASRPVRPAKSICCNQQILLFLV